VVIITPNGFLNYMVWSTQKCTETIVTRHCKVLRFFHWTSTSTGRLPRKTHALHQWCLRMLPGSGITSSPTMKFDARPTNLYHGNYPGTTSNPIRAYRPNGRQCRRKADLDFLAFCVLEETTRTTTDDLDEDGAERPRLPWAVMDRRS